MTAAPRPDSFTPPPGLSRLRAAHDWMERQKLAVRLASAAAGGLTADTSGARPVLRGHSALFQVTVEVWINDRAKTVSARITANPHRVMMITLDLPNHLRNPRTERDLA